MKTIVAALLVLLTFVSCQKDDSQATAEDLTLVGTWNNPQYNDTLITYERTENLIKNEPGFIFNAYDKCIERKNSGWCGTPPITCDDYEGTWTRNDSIVTIHTGHWVGNITYTWKIISLTETRLVVSIAKIEYR